SACRLHHFSHHFRNGVATKSFRIDEKVDHPPQQRYGIGHRRLRLSRGEATVCEAADIQVREMSQIHFTKERDQVLLERRPVGGGGAALELVVGGPPAKRLLPMNASAELKADAASEPVLPLSREIAFDLRSNSLCLGPVRPNRLLPLATVFVNPDVPLVPLPVPDDFRAHRWSSGSDRSDPERGPEQPERKRPELKYGISQPVDSLSLSGAGNGSRTRDPQLGKLMLYQLSYSRVVLRVARGDAASKSQASQRSSSMRSTKRPSISSSSGGPSSGRSPGPRKGSAARPLESKIGATSASGSMAARGAEPGRAAGRDVSGNALGAGDSAERTMDGEVASPAAPGVEIPKSCAARATSMGLTVRRPTRWASKSALSARVFTIRGRPRAAPQSAATAAGSKIRGSPPAARTR